MWKSNDEKSSENIQHECRAVASGGQGGNCPLPPKPADNFLKRPNLRARLRADLFLSGFSKLKSQEMHF